MSLARLGSALFSLRPPPADGALPQDRPPVTQRSRTPDGGLASLADPLPFNLDNSLEAALRERVESRVAQMPSQANAVDWRDAMALILAVDRRDETPHARPAVCRIAVTLLLEQGQGRLLCRLAELKNSLNFELDVGLNLQRARLLVRIAASWPQDVAVTLRLDATLYRDDLLALHAFVQRPLRFSLHITANTMDTLETASVMGLVVGRRALETLSLDIHEHSLPVLQDLCGAQARCIQVVATRSGGSTTDSDEEGDDENGIPVSAAASYRAQLAHYLEAAVDLVRSSGARELRLPHCQWDPDLSGRLLASRVDWDTVELSTADPGVLRDWFVDGTLRIARLELSVWLTSKFFDVGALLFMASKNGVHTIVVHDTVTLRDMVKGLEVHASRSAHLFDWIEASFAVDTADTAQPARFEQEVLEPLSKSGAVLTLRNAPPSDTRNGAFFPAATVPLGKDYAHRLDTISTLNRSRSFDDHLAITLRAVDRVRAATVRHIRVALADGGGPAELVHELVMLAPPLIRPKSSLRPLPPFEADLKGTLAALEWFGVEVSLIQRGIALCVFDHPAMGPQLCLALLGTALPKKTLKQTEWIRLGELYQRKPIELSRLDEPSVPVAAPSRVAPGGPATAAVVGGAPAVQGQPTGADLIALVHSNGPKALADLIARLRQSAAARSDPAVQGACDVLVHLLETGEFEPEILWWPGMALELVRQLLEAGQGAVLKHIVHTSPRDMDWTLSITSLTMAQALNALTPWPQDMQCVCVIDMHADLPRDAVDQVVAFAATLTPQQLKLRCVLGEKNLYGALVGMVEAHPGARLTIQGRAAPLDVDAAVTFLNKLRSTPLSGLGLSNLSSGDMGLVDAVVGVLEHTGVKRIDVLNCSAVLADKVLTFRRWEGLRVDCVPAMSGLFTAALVSTDKLYIVVPGDARQRAQAPVENMVANCAGLKSLVVERGAVELLALARGLDRNRCVESVVGYVSLGDYRRREQAFGILQRNPSLRHLDIAEVTGDNPLLRQRLVQLMTHHWLRRPASQYFSVGQGFGSSMGGGAWTDIGGRLGSMLNPTDFGAFARTSKAAYAASRLPWQVGIDRLAKVLGIADAAGFKTGVMQSLPTQDPSLPPFLSLPAPPAQAPASTLLERVAFMQSVGVPDLAIGEALGHALNADLARSPSTSRRATSTRTFLEAMATVGAYPAESWLKDVYGIDVQAAGQPNN